MTINTQKKKHIISYENLSEEVKAVFKEKYPRGFNDYLPDIKDYTKPDGTKFYAVTLELPEDVWLIKFQIKTESLEDLENWLNTEPETDQESGSEGDAVDGTLPDSDITQYSDDSADADM
ncbi:MAG: hypothetical protein MJY97_09480 [Bacteroidales bacterium]|nr:hypothetical protein [Bacteroidales bacterium]